ncbi:hypothetical protein RHMOL_Rhmol09G0156900 [Rhododendron molle]|uniref:Uncharacterized protein n=1 Tax=Rhododendron molle TaxID=49168 RepID=A0ACC0MF68_RHOML|nr:hypothetical protein RHMOL_Rhmol09G0156900 [Rhododendron molle]
MWLAGGRRLIYSSLVALLMISVFFNRSAGAIRTHPQSRAFKQRELITHPMKKPNQNQNDLLRKYFNGRASDLSTNTSSTQIGFQESKRRIPSCPDALHNK